MQTQSDASAVYTVYALEVLQLQQILYLYNAPQSV